MIREWLKDKKIGGIVRMECREQLSTRKVAHTRDNSFDIAANSRALTCDVVGPITNINCRDAPSHNDGLRRLLYADSIKVFNYI